MRQSRKISKLNFPSFLVVLATLFVPLANATTEPAKPATPAMAAAPAPAAMKADTAAGDALYNNGDPSVGWLPVLAVMAPMVIVGLQAGQNWQRSTRRIP